MAFIISSRVTNTAHQILISVIYKFLRSYVFRYFSDILEILNLSGRSVKVIKLFNCEIKCRFRCEYSLTNVTHLHFFL